MKDEEIVRLKNMWQIEDGLAERGYSVVAGVDEAGRGPLAGSVYAAVVILPHGVLIEGLNDSKKISEKKREKIYEEVKKQAIAYAVATATAEEIDEINIRNATYVAMNRAIENLKQKAEYVLVDGDFIKDCKYPYETIIKGDAKSASIAAASILAKVERDRYMLEVAEKYPQYGFEKHKGYGTALHIAKLKEYGECEIHRKTFIKKFI